MRKFIPIFVLAAILPFIIGVVTSPDRLLFAPQAANSDVLRLWTSPNHVTATINQPTTIHLYASFDSDKSLGTGLTLTLTPNPAFLLSQTVFVAPPFAGQILLGTLTLTPVTPGTSTLDLDPTQIIAPVPQSAISTQGLTITAN